MNGESGNILFIRKYSKFAEYGKTWTLLHIVTGCYELNDVNAEIT